MISDIFHVIYDALLQIIARLEIDISVYLPRRLIGCLTSGLYQPFSSHAVCHRHLMINAESVSFQISIIPFSTQSALCMFMMQIAAAITLGCYFPSFAIAVSIFSCSCFMLFSFVMPPSTGSPTILPFRSIT